MSLTTSPPGLLRRFRTTVIANLLRGGFGLANGLVMARALGAARYGDLTFLLASFTSILTLADMGGGSAFFTFLSAKKRGHRFFVFYAALLATQFLVTALVVLLLPVPWLDILWVGQHRGLVLIAFLGSFLSAQIWTAFLWLGEAVRQTLHVQTLNALRAAAHLALLLLLLAAHCLTVPVILWLYVAEYSVFALIFAGPLVQANLAQAGEAGSEAGYGEIVRMFLRFCRPLILYAWVGLVYTFADNWLLQRFGGAMQQGLFGVAKQFSVIALVATKSILSVFWKEAAAAHEAKDHARLEMVYNSVLRGSYLAGALLCAALVPYSREIIALLLGPGYVAGAACLMLMFFYPVHQAMGQIQGAFFNALGQTRTRSAIGVITMALSLPTAYFLIAPRTLAVPGMQLGAVGLALKLVVVQIAIVNLQGILIARRHGWRANLQFQTVLPILAGIAWVSRAAADWASAACRLPDPAVWTVGGGLAAYGLLAVTLLAFAPGIAGFRRGELHELGRWLFSAGHAAAA